MSEKVDIWMPFYVSDYLSDTMHLTAAEHGGYLMLILHYWKSGPIPNDSARLATISRLGDAWSNASSTILAFFKQCDGMLVHERIDREKARASEYKEKKVARAKFAAGKRWQKNADSNATSMPDALPEECPSPSPSQSSNEDIKTLGKESPESLLNDVNLDNERPTDDNKPVRFEGRRALVTEGVDDQVAADFIKLRTAKRSPLSQSALDGIKREAIKAGLSLPDVILICVERGWQGFNASWLSPSDNSKRSTPSASMRVNNLDHSSTSAAMAASMKRHGIVVSDNDDPIDF